MPAPCPCRLYPSGSNDNRPLKNGRSFGIKNGWRLATGPPGVRSCAGIQRRKVHFVVGPPKIRRRHRLPISFVYSSVWRRFSGFPGGLLDRSAAGSSRFIGQRVSELAGRFCERGFSAAIRQFRCGERFVEREKCFIASGHDLDAGSQHFISDDGRSAKQGPGFVPGIDADVGMTKTKKHNRPSWTLDGGKIS